jgi:stalled ribosome alternative rescue factor ArfA
MKQAKKELAEELFREKVEKAKEQLRKQKKSWFPWRLKIINVNRFKRGG